MNKTRRRGRPVGPTRTREDILDVARRRFLADGYAGVTLRSLAQEAGVDAALISYHFGSKSGLFAASLQLPANPPEVLAAALAGPLEQLPERLLRAVLATWDDPERGAGLRVMAEGAVRDPEMRRLFREVIERELISRIADRLGGAAAERRAAAVAVQIAGLIFLRYVLQAEPVASLSADELVRHVAPALRAAAAGPPRRRAQLR
jgi:AcrR family transcriptional regulator